MSHALGWPEIVAALALRTARPLPVPCGRRAAVALVLCERQVEIELLFVRRAEHPDDPWSGHVAFPGGRAEPGDRDLLSTARRETMEEIGLDLEADADHLGTLDELQAMRRGGAVDLSIAPFVFRLRRQPTLVLGDEVVSAHCVALATLLAPATRSTLSVAIDDRARDLPCLCADGQTIWGLTLRMFDDFAERLRAVGAEQPREEGPA